MVPQKNMMGSWEKNTNDKHVFLNDRHDEQASLKNTRIYVIPFANWSM
jgi:hypothetical protein